MHAPRISTAGPPSFRAACNAAPMLLAAPDCTRVLSASAGLVKKPAMPCAANPMRSSSRGESTAFGGGAGELQPSPNLLATALRASEEEEGARAPLCALVLSTHVPRHARSDVRDRRDGLQLPRTTLVTAGRVFGRLHAVRACFYDAVASDANLHTALSPSPPRESHALRSRARLAREVIARTRDRADSPHRHSIRRHARARAPSHTPPGP